MLRKTWKSTTTVMIGDSSASPSAGARLLSRQSVDELDGLHQRPEEPRLLERMLELQPWFGGRRMEQVLAG
jgi:hypothetical protein